MPSACPPGPTYRSQPKVEANSTDTRAVTADEHSSFSQLLLHLVQHAGEGGLQLESFLDLVCTHVRIFSVFQKTRALMVAYELDERRGIRLPVLREPLEVFKDGPKAGLREDAHRVFCVLVEVGVEDALVHEVAILADVKEQPAQVVQLKHGEEVRSLGDALLNPF